MHAAKEALWLQKLVGQIYPKCLSLPITLYCDNQAAIKLITTDNYHSHTKHLDQRYQFIRDLAGKKTIELKYFPSEDMVADMLTKALPKWKVAGHCTSLRMRHASGGVLA
jgi:hypothetical protein